MRGSDTIAIMEVFVLLVAAASLIAVATRRVTILPYSVALTCLGLAVAALALPVQVTVSPEILLAVLVPGLVFEAAYRIRISDLVPNLAAVGLLATVGVLITAGIVGVIVMSVTDLPFSSAFLVGTMLAATDPAAVVAVISKLRAPRRLTTLVEAESLFNDGTGIVIFVLAIAALGRDVPPIELAGGLFAVVAISTVIGTDIVGSTQRAAELGDQGWRELVERHHAVVRALLARYRGVEVDTAGDGFFATFDGPARAVRCAQACVQALSVLGIEIRTGVHTGEVETIDSKVGGIAVSIGARVGGHAGPSEVFVSQTVNDLVAGSGLEFEDTGERELKGVPDRWHLYRVLAA